MVSTSLSLILLAADMSKTSCEQIFTSLVAKENKAILDKTTPEAPLLEKFVDAACKSPNPDIVWILSRIETHFRPMSIMDNTKKKSYSGENAAKIVMWMQENKDSLSLDEKNIDMGIMQINYKVHSNGFISPMQAFHPEAQIRYLFSDIIPERKAICGNDWLECYHSYTKAPREKYAKKIRHSNKKLQKYLGLTDAMVSAIYYQRETNLANINFNHMNVSERLFERNYEVYSLAMDFNHRTNMFNLTRP